jgi:hypothetical protein
MVTLEQIRQLETKIGKAIDYVHRVSGENVRLRGELDGSEKRIAELEAAVQRFREEQGRIEEGILAALDKLDQFEDAVNTGLSTVQAVVAAAAPVASVADPPPPGDTPHEDALPGGEPSDDTSPGDALSDETPSGDAPPDEEASGGEPSPYSEETGADELDIF